MIDWFRYNRKFRRFLIWISHYILEDQINEFLYPGDCMIRFS